MPVEKRSWTNILTMLRKTVALELPQDALPITNSRWSRRAFLVVCCGATLARVIGLQVRSQVAEPVAPSYTNDRCVYCRRGEEPGEKRVLLVANGELICNNCDWLLGSAE